jgi:antitoxin ParD1/3/4
MNVSLTPKLEQFIQNQIATGKYASAEEVVLAALKMFEILQSIYRRQFEQLQREIVVNLEASSHTEVVSSETVFSQPTPLGKGWIPGFFEEVIGGWVGEPLERAEQGAYEIREPLF